MKKSPGFLLVLFSVFLLTTCAGLTRYEMLSFFFDGVPEPGSTKQLADTDTVFSEEQIRNTNQIKPVESSAFVHKPYAQKQCSVCHDTQSGNRVKGTEITLCASCHRTFNEEYVFEHGPVAVGQCTPCHNPHSENNVNLLVLQPNELCVNCHTRFKDADPPGHQSKDISDCTLCHSPHFSNTSRFFVSLEKSP